MTTDHFAALRKSVVTVVTPVTAIKSLGNSCNQSVVTLVAAGYKKDQRKQCGNQVTRVTSRKQHSPDWLEGVPERAAILIADAGVPDCYADDLALLMCAPCPPDIAPAHWHRAIDALGCLIDDARALAMVVKLSGRGADHG